MGIDVQVVAKLRENDEIIRLLETEKIDYVIITARATAIPSATSSACTAARCSFPSRA
jgi:hypothetical protein